MRENVAGERHIYSDRAVDMKWHEGGDSQQGKIKRLNWHIKCGHRQWWTKSGVSNERYQGVLDWGKSKSPKAEERHDKDGV